ncbi:MAG: sigma-54 dependent transcriptional regulator [Pirellulaceae bacterium]|nr:sigma-54 dependent transcriptional regulator [Pirellulaceae bacterium]
MTKPQEIDLLVVDDDAELRETLVRRFELSGFAVRGAASSEEALDLAQRRHFDVAVLDMMLPGISGLELLKKLKELYPESEVILLTGQGTIETAVEAMQSGAFHYLTKPFPLRDLETQIEKAFERGQLRKENERLRALLARSQPAADMIGQSPAMREVFRLIQRAGPSDKAILIQGESGTGKELVARALHRCSLRADKPLVVINCAALPETLLESELFGHEKGAFTGAHAAKPGLFEVADGGTLFIDEIGEMPGSLQAKLLRVLEDGSLRRIGSIQERKVNVRLLAATNRDLANEVAAGRFREDLYYRINVMSLELPPLRERAGDIPLLLEKFLGSQWQLEPAAAEHLAKFPWPGNVRQLMNAIERAKIMAEGNLIRLADLPKEVAHAKATNDQAASSSDDLATMQRHKIIEVLRREACNKSRAAKALGIDRRKLYRLLEKYTITDVELFRLAGNGNHHSPAPPEPAAT